MQHRGRKSAAELSVVTPINVTRWEPPGHLTDAQAQVWRIVIGSKPSDWFTSASLLHVEQYCASVCEAKRLQSLMDELDTECLKTPEGMSVYKELTKAKDVYVRQCKSLATSMRLTHQSLYRADAAEVASRRGSSGARPWSAVVGDNLEETGT